MWWMAFFHPEKSSSPKGKPTHHHTVRYWPFIRLYQSCAILGGTLMPHTLYIGSGMAQARLRHFDIKHSSYRETMTTSKPQGIKLYRPSLLAIKSCLNYSIAELCITLFIVAVFVNSSILIIAAASLSESAQDADLFGMYALFVQSISQVWFLKATSPFRFLVLSRPMP